MLRGLYNQIFKRPHLVIMLKIKNLSVNLADSKKEILKEINIEVNHGEIHIINGKNGSGKSTLVNALMGNPAFKISSGDIQLINEEYSEFIIGKLSEELKEQSDFKNNNSVVNITEAQPNEKSLLGLFLANQYPVEIPGVNLMHYLRMIYNSRRSKEDQLGIFKFKQLVYQKAKLINYPEALLLRNLNEGFSGGEKKKTEILQMFILEPKYVMLDEIDSGLDKTSVQEVFSGLAKYKEENPAVAFIIITHYDRVKEYLSIDFEHDMETGTLIS